MSFHLDQEVVCIQVQDYLGSFWKQIPRKGQTYRIRGLFWDMHAGRQGCLLHGVNNNIHKWADGQVMEAGFPVIWFRPVVKGKKEISMATFTGPMGPTMPTKEVEYEPSKTN